MGDWPEVSPPLGSRAGKRHRTPRWGGPTSAPTFLSPMPCCLEAPGSSEVTAEGVQAPRAAWTVQRLGHRASFLFQSSPALSLLPGTWRRWGVGSPVFHPGLCAGQQRSEAWTISWPIGRLTEPCSSGPLVSETRLRSCVVAVPTVVTGVWSLVPQDQRAPQLPQEPSAPENISSAQSSHTDPQTLFVFLLSTGPHRTSSPNLAVTDQPPHPPPRSVPLGVVVSHNCSSSLTIPASWFSPKGQGQPLSQSPYQAFLTAQMQAGEVDMEPLWAFSLPGEEAQEKRPQAECLTQSLEAPEPRGRGKAAKPCPLVHSLGPGFGPRMAPDPAGPFLNTLGGIMCGSPAEASHE